MQDWYYRGQLTIFPLGATIALHVLVLAFLLVRFQSSSDPRTIEASVMAPSIINATLIDASSLKPKPKPKQASRPKPKPKPKARPAARESVASTPTTRKPQAAEVAPTPAPAARPRPEPKPEPQRLTAEEMAQISRRELAQSMESEDATQVSVTAEQMAASYAALIRDTVTSYWSRPPSARNGMQALLELQLIPTGEIVSVSVVKSSGSTAFDRSALNAVDKAGSFRELKNLPNREFEKSFRRFQLLFNPEDLRY
jgi:TonB family protein